MIPVGIKDLPAKPKESPCADAWVHSKTYSALCSISLVTLKNLPAHAPGHNVALPRCLTGTLLHLFLVLKFSVPSHLAVTSSGLLLGGSIKMPSLGVRGTSQKGLGLMASCLLPGHIDTASQQAPRTTSILTSITNALLMFQKLLWSSQCHPPTSSAFPAPLLSLSGSWHTVRIPLRGSS